MNRFQDIKISDKPLISNYITYFLNGDYANAFNILNNAQLDKKTFIDETLNIISNLLYNLENYYFSNVPEYFPVLTNKLQLIIDNYIDMGEWNPSTTYQIYNYVIYNDYYYLYINEDTPAANILPTNTSYWKFMGFKGDKGAQGLGVNLRYNWQSTANYLKYDIVYYNNILWVATEDNTNIEPTDTYETESVTLLFDSYFDSSYPYSGIINSDSIDANGILDTTNLSLAITPSWEKFLGFNNASIYIDDQQPLSTYEGLIWFQVVE